MFLNANPLANARKVDASSVRVYSFQQCFCLFPVETDIFSIGNNNTAEFGNDFLDQSLLIPNPTPTPGVSSLEKNDAPLYKLLLLLGYESAI